MKMYTLWCKLNATAAIPTGYFLYSSSFLIVIHRRAAATKTRFCFICNAALKYIIYTFIKENVCIKVSLK